MSQRDIYRRRVIQILLGIDCIPRNHKEKLALIVVQVHINNTQLHIAIIHKKIQIIPN